MSVFFAVDGDCSAGSGQETPLRSVNFGMEPDPSMAHWGPCPRRHGILHYVTSGMGYFDGQPVSAGQGFYIAPGVIHEYHSSADEPWRYYWVMFDGGEETVGRIIQPDRNGIFGFGFTDELIGIYDRLKRYLPVLNRYEAMSALNAILGLHARGVRGEAGGGAGNPVIRSAKSFIEANLASGCTVTGIADALHICDRYLYNLFMKHLGVPPKRYIDERRMCAARGLLSGTDIPVGLVASAVGFPDPAQFSRFFARHEGISPTGYRDKMKG